MAAERRCPAASIRRRVGPRRVWGSPPGVERRAPGAPGARRRWWAGGARSPRDRPGGRSSRHLVESDAKIGIDLLDPLPDLVEPVIDLLDLAGPVAHLRLAPPHAGF